MWEAFERRVSGDDRVILDERVIVDERDEMWSVPRDTKETKEGARMFVKWSPRHTSSCGGLEEYGEAYAQNCTRGNREIGRASSGVSPWSTLCSGTRLWSTLCCTYRRCSAASRSVVRAVVPVRVAPSGSEWLSSEGLTGSVSSRGIPRHVRS